jgi:EmrB/QacA subfamily drug resistance transporter
MTARFRTQLIFALRRPSGPRRTQDTHVMTDHSARQKALCFIAVGVALLLGSIDQTAMSTALPELSGSLDTNLAIATWSIIGYQLGQIVAMPAVGTISDQFGRRRVFLCCLALFTLASLAAALAPNIWTLILLRLLQGVGAGGFIPAATGIISDVFGDSRDRGIALFTSIFPIGNLVGPIVGGFIIYHWSWRWVLLLNVPIGVVCVILALTVIPASRPEKVGRFDFLGLFLLTVSSATAMIGITLIGTSTSLASVLGCVALAAVATLTFVALFRRSAKLENPILAVRFLRRGPLLSMNLVSFLYGGVIIGLSALVPLYAQVRYGLTPLEAGTTLSGRAIGAITVTTATAILLRRIGTRLPMLVGFGLAAVGVFLLSIPPIIGGAFLWLALCTTVTGIGGGMGAPSSMNAGLRLAGQEIGSTSGLRGLFRQIGGLVYVTVGSTVVSASHENPVVFASVLAAFSATLLLIVIPLVLSVPDEKGKW